MIMLDLFCGYKGASRAMRERGWNVITVDNKACMSPTFVADMLDFHWTEEAIPDLVWASPPCEEFSRWSMPWTRRKMKHRPDLQLIIASLRVIAECRPRFWVLENVRGAIPFLGKPAAVYGAYHLWGVFPPFEAVVIKKKSSMNGSLKQHRAIVPYAVSLALAKACEDSYSRIYSTSPEQGKVQK